MKKIFITGANGFIGKAIVDSFSSKYKVIVFDKEISNENYDNGVSLKGDITDICLVKKICSTHVPDVIVHCAGIVHQSLNSASDKHQYGKVNDEATTMLAKEASAANPNVHFIFLSTVSVYGENKNCKAVKEEDPCSPETEYAKSKLNAEQGLVTFFNEGSINKLDILRLAPVYDSTNMLNLEKRVFAPKKWVFLKYGSGEQKISILSRQNIVDFIQFRIQENTIQNFCNTFNVTDTIPCSFNKIRKIFKRSNSQSKKMTIRIPLMLILIGTQLAALILKSKSEWIRSCYDKLADDMIFDNNKMLDSGFCPEYTIETVLVKE